MWSIWNYAICKATTKETSTKQIWTIFQQLWNSSMFQSRKVFEGELWDNYPHICKTCIVIRKVTLINQNYICFHCVNYCTKKETSFRRIIYNVRCTLATVLIRAIEKTWGCTITFHPFYLFPNNRLEGKFPSLEHKKVINNTDIFLIR